MAEKVTITLEVDEKGGVRGLDSVREKIDAITPAAKRASLGLSDMRLSVVEANESIRYLREIGNGAIESLKGIVHRGAELDLVMRKIAGKSGEGAEAIRALKGRLDEIAVKYSGNQVELGQTVLQLLRDGAQNSTEAIQILIPSLKLAKAASISLGEASALVHRNMQVYGKAASEAAKFTNDLFVASDIGRLSIQELAGASLSNAGAQRQLAVSLQEVLATMIALDAAGRSLGDITSGLGGIFDGLLKPSEKLLETYTRLGVVTGKDLVEKFGGLEGAIKAVRKDMDANGDGFIRAFRGANTLSIAIEILNKSFLQTPELMQKMQGSTDALDRRLKDQGGSVLGLQKKWEALKEVWTGEVFDKIERSTKTLGETMIGLFEVLIGFERAHPGLVAVGVVVTGLVGTLAIATAATMQVLVNLAEIIKFTPILSAALKSALSYAGGMLGIIGGAPGIAAIAAISAIAYGVTKLGGVLETNAGKAQTAGQAMADYAKKTGMARAAVEGMNNTPLRLWEKGIVESEVRDVEEGLRSGLDKMRELVKDGNKEAAKQMFDDLLVKYGEFMSKLPKPEAVSLFGKTVFADNAGSAESFALWDALNKEGKEIPGAKAPPGTNKWSDTLSKINDQYQGIIDAQNLLADSVARHIESLARAQAPAEAIGDAVRKEVEHRVAALQVQVKLNEALLAAGVAAKAPPAEMEKFRAEVEAANSALRDQALILAESIETAMSAVQNAAQGHADALSAQVEAKQAIYDLSVKMQKPDAEILGNAEQLQVALTEAANSTVELAARMLDVAKNSGASADQLAKFSAQLQLAQAKAQDTQGAIRDAHREIKGMYETIKIDPFENFRQGMRESFAAVVNGTRDMKDVWKGVREAATGQMFDAFGAIIFGKKRLLDDPMEKNLGGIGDLFGKTAQTGRNEFGGMFGWVADGVKALFGRGGVVPNAIENGGRGQYQASAVRSGLAGVVSPATLAQQQQEQAGGLFGGFLGQLGGGIGDVFSSAKNWFNSNFSGASSWLNKTFGGLFGKKALTQYDIPVGGSAQVNPDGSLSNPSSSPTGQASGAFAGFSAGYGSALGAIGAGLGQIKGFYANKTQQAIVEIASLIPVYGYLAYAVPILDHMGKAMNDLVGVHNQIYFDILANPLMAFIRSKKSDKDIIKSSFGKLLGGIVNDANPEYFLGTLEKSIVPRGQGVSMVQRANEGLETGQVARLLALTYLGGTQRSTLRRHDREQPNINNSGYLGAYNILSGEIQGMFDLHPDMAEKFGKDIMQALGGTVANVVNMVQNGILKVVNQTKRPGETDMYAYERLRGLHPDDPFPIGKQGHEGFRQLEGSIMPSIEEAVSMVVTIFAENLPRAIRDNAQAIVDAEFAREAANPSVDKNARGGEINTVKGTQIARAFELEQGAFQKLADAFNDAGSQMLQGATKREALDVMKRKLRDTVIAAASEGIGAAFVNDVLTNNILAPALKKLDRGLLLASEAKTPEDALKVLHNLTSDLGIDIAEIEKNVAKLAPLLSKYVKLQERIAIAATSFDDIAEAARNLVKSLRGSIAVFTSDLATQQKLATAETASQRRQALRTLERRLGSPIGDVTAESLAGLSDSNLKRMPDLLERARAAIVANAELELNYLGQRLSLAKQWASLKDPAVSALRTVTEFGRQNTKPAISAFEDARSQVQTMLKDLRSEDEATRYAASQNLISAGPQLLELAKQAGYAPGSQTFEDLRATLQAALSSVQKEAAAREVESLNLQREFDRVQKEALQQLQDLADIAKGVDKEAKQRQIELLEESINYDELSLGALQTQSEAMDDIVRILDRGINVVQVGKGGKDAFEPLQGAGLSSGGLVTGSARSFTLHPPELVVPLDRVDSLFGLSDKKGSGQDRPVEVHITQVIGGDSSGNKTMKAEEEFAFVQQLRRAMRDPAFVEEVSRLARRAQKEA